MEWLLLAVIVAVTLLSGLYLSWTAGRTDRQHTRVEAARATLDAELFHRAGVAVEVAASGVLDPAQSLIVLDAAHAARAAPPTEREEAESDLSGVLAAVFAGPPELHGARHRPGAESLLDELSLACRRVEMARRFHNDTVASARNLRRRRSVRWFGLAGRAPLPTTVEMNDAPPPGLRGGSAQPYDGRL